MILLIYIAALAVTAASGQDTNLSELPKCAQGCLVNAISQRGSCAETDVGCLCRNINYINVVACCLAGTCNLADQEKAITVNSQLCSNANVSIPNYIGCSPSLASKYTFGSSTAQSTSSAGLLATGAIQSAIVLPSGGPVAKFAGDPIFTAYAQRTTSRPAVLAALRKRPFPPSLLSLSLSCQWKHIANIRTNNKSGWSIFTSPIAGQTPCYSVPTVPIIPPSSTAPGNQKKRAQRVDIVVTSELYTLKYPLRRSPRLPPRAIAGIAVGGVLALILIFALTALSIRVYRKRKDEKARKRNSREGESNIWSSGYNTNNGDGFSYFSAAGDKRRSTFSHAGSGRSTAVPHGTMSEDMVPSPVVTSPLTPQVVMSGAGAGGGYWVPYHGAGQERMMTTPPPPMQQMMQRLPSPPPPPPPPPQELMGSTRMDEHHPAYKTPREGEEEGTEGGQQRPYQLHEPVGSPEVVSPISEEAGRR
ncbi:MAG: hypothetical protein Q9167_007062 [Letrouitia subvulpina]